MTLEVQCHLSAQCSVEAVRVSRCQVAAPVPVSVSVSWVSSPLVSTESSLHLHGTFFMFGAVLLLLLPVSYLILPETKDISLGDLLVN